MNIACIACPARYAISDEKIVGRKVRIGCKRCGTKLIIDGTTEPPEVRADTGVSSMPPAPRFHLAISHDQRERGDLKRVVELYGRGAIFANTLAWRDDQSPLPVGINPRITFERMFGETGPQAQRISALRQKQSMLDSVMAETAKLKGSLGPADNAILDEYLTNVRQVESKRSTWCSAPRGMRSAARPGRPMQT